MIGTAVVPNTKFTIKTLEFLNHSPMTAISLKDFDPKTLIFRNLKGERFGKRIVIKRQEDNQFLPLIISSPDEKDDVPDSCIPFYSTLFPKVF